MSKSFATAILILGCMLGSSQAAELYLGDLRIDWLDGYKETGGSSPIHLVGPDGVNVLVTVWSATPKVDSDPTTDAQTSFSNIATARLPELAAVQGKVVLPLQREVLPDGSVLYFTATQAGSRRRPEFYLQYMLVAPSAKAALFTVEGKGDAMLEHPRFLERFSSVRWADAR